MADPNALPAGAIGRALLDPRASDFKTRLEGFTREIRSALKQVGVTGCVVATKEVEGLLDVVVFPAASTSRAGTKDSLSAAGQELKKTVNAAARAVLAQTAPGGTAAALGPRPTGGAGIGLRPGPKKR